MNNLQLVHQVKTSIATLMQARTTFQYLKSLGTTMNPKSWRDYNHALSALVGSVREGRQVAFALESSQREYRRRYGRSAPGAAAVSDYAYQRWWGDNRAMVDRTLLRVGLRASDFDDERRGIAKIQQLSRTKQRRDEILQAGNELATAQAMQLQRLREIGLMQIRMQGEMFTAEQQQQTFTQDGVRKALMTPRFSSGPRFR